MLGAPVTARFEDVERAGHVAVDVVVRVRERMPHAGLGGEVDDAHGLPGEGGVDRGRVVEIAADELEPRVDRRAVRAGAPSARGRSSR